MTQIIERGSSKSGRLPGFLFYDLSAEISQIRVQKYYDRFD